MNPFNWRFPFCYTGKKPQLRGYKGRIYEDHPVIFIEIFCGFILADILLWILPFYYMFHYPSRSSCESMRLVLRVVITMSQLMMSRLVGSLKEFVSIRQYFCTVLFTVFTRRSVNRQTEVQQATQYYCTVLCTRKTDRGKQATHQTRLLIINQYAIINQPQ